MTHQAAPDRLRPSTLMALLVVAFVGQSWPALAQNPGAVVQSAATVTVAAQVVDPAVTASAGQVQALADSLLSDPPEAVGRTSGWVPRETRLRRIHVNWMGPVEAVPLRRQADRPRRLRITVAFASN